MKANFFSTFSSLAGPFPGAHIERASDGKDGHGGFCHGVKCRSVAKPSAVAPLFWSGKAHGQ